MSSRVLKNDQISLGRPFYIKTSVGFEVVEKNYDEDQEKYSDVLEAEEEMEDPASILERVREEAQKEAEYIIESAKIEASKIIAQAEEEAAGRAANIEKEAAERGYSQGVQKAQSQYENILQEAQSIREQAKAEYKQMLEGLEKDFIEIVLAIARKVIGEEVRINKENILFLIKQAFEKCTNKDEIVLKVSDADYEYVVKNREKLLKMMEGAGKFEIKKDPSLNDASCILETPLGSVNAGADTKLDKIEEEFLKVVGD